MYKANRLRPQMIISAFTILILTYVSYRQSAGFVAWLIPDSSVRPFAAIPQEEF